MPRHRRLAATTLIGTAAAVSVLGVAAAGAMPCAVAGTVGTTVHPKSGAFAGEEATVSPIPFSFTVSAHRRKVRDISGQAEVRAGCQNPITGFGTGAEPARVSRSGHFRQVTSGAAYSQPGVRVVVRGHFVTPRKAKGTITVRLRGVKGCDATVRWRATRAKA